MSREEKLNDAICSPDTDYPRKISLRTLAMADRVGINILGINQNSGLSSLGDMIYLLCGNAEEVCRTVYREPSLFEIRADNFLGTLSQEDFNDIVQKIIDDNKVISQTKIETQENSDIPKNALSPRA